MYININDQTPMTTLMAIYHELGKEEYKYLSDYFHDPDFAKNQIMELKNILGNPSIENPIPIATILAVRGTLLPSIAILAMGSNEQFYSSPVYQKLKISLQNATANAVYIVLDNISTIIGRSVFQSISTENMEQQGYDQLVKTGKEVVLSTSPFDYVSLRIIDILDEFQRKDGLVNFNRLINKCNILYEYHIDYFDDPYDDPCGVNSTNEADNDRQKLKELHKSQQAFYKMTDAMFKNIINPFPTHD